MDSQPDNNCPSDSDTHLNGIDQEMEYDRMDSGNRQTFTEVFLGCSDSYPSRLTFMDLFWQDEHAEKQQEKIFSFCFRQQVAVLVLVHMLWA